MPSPGSEPVETSRKPYPAISNRRRSVRQRVHLPASANLIGRSTGIASDLSEVVDLSEDGVCIQTSSPLAPNALLALSLNLVESKPSISTTGEVVWSDHEGRHGIHFSEISEECRQQIKQWLFANAVSIGINQARNIAPAREVPAPTSHTSSASQETKQQSVRQSPEQTRAEIAAATESIDIAVPADYSAVLSALVAVKREVEVAGADLDRALQLLCDRALSLTDATGAAIAIAMEADGEMICRARAGSDAPGMGARLQVGSGFSGECVRAGTVLSCDDTEMDPRVDREGSRLLGIRSMMAAPIRQEEKVVGLLEIFSPNPHAFRLNDQKILERLAEMIAASMNRARAARPEAEPDRISDSTRGPRFKALPQEERAQPQIEMPIEIGRLLEPTTSPLRVVLMAIGVGALIILIWLVASWTKSDNMLRNAARPATAARQELPKISEAPTAGTSDLDKLRKLATDGDPNAQFDLGARYATGEDVKQNYAESVRWFTLAAEQGHVIAQATLGAYYWAGRGIPQDLSKAYFWSAIAQAGGDEASKYRVSVLATRMNPGQLSAAQQQANGWIKKHQPAARAAQNISQ